MSLHEDLSAVSVVTFFSRGVVTDESPVLLWATLNSLRKEGMKGGRRRGKRNQKKDKGTGLERNTERRGQERERGLNMTYTCS